MYSLDSLLNIYKATWSEFVVKAKISSLITWKPLQPFFPLSYHLGKNGCNVWLLAPFWLASWYENSVPILLGRSVWVNGLVCLQEKPSMNTWVKFWYYYYLHVSDRVRRRGAASLCRPPIDEARVLLTTLSSRAPVRNRHHDLIAYESRVRASLTSHPDGLPWHLTVAVARNLPLHRGVIEVVESATPNLRFTCHQHIEMPDFVN